MGEFGVDSLAADQIATQFINLSFVIVLALSQTATVQVGQAVGRNDRSRVVRSTYVCLALGLFLITAVGLVYVFYPTAIIALDLDVHAPQYQAVVRYTTWFLAIGALAQLLDCARYVFVGALRGIKDTKAPLYVSFVIFWIIMLPLAYVFGFFWHWQGVGLWAAIVLGVLIGLIILWMRFTRLVQHVDLAAMVLKS